MSDGGAHGRDAGTRLYLLYWPGSAQYPDRLVDLRINFVHELVRHRVRALVVLDRGGASRDAQVVAYVESHDIVCS